LRYRLQCFSVSCAKSDVPDFACFAACMEREQMMVRPGTAQMERFVSSRHDLQIPDAGVEILGAHQIRHVQRDATQAADPG
jgi:hypothetical protein